MRTLKDITSAMSVKDDTPVSLVSHAYEFALDAHNGQTRYSGEPYFTHLAEVAYMLADAGMDAQSIAAGLLHDSVEDRGVLPTTIEKEFGPEVRRLVDGVTKLGTVRYRGLDRHIESLRKFFAATANDLRVLIIKLTDRLHNVRTLSFVPEHKQKRIAMETLEIYAPIADRLGMSVMKTDLEDASFPFAYPKEYEKVRALVKERKKENDKRLEKMEHDLKRELADAGLRNFRAEARIKGVYSLFRKLERKDWDITTIFDILALRIILPNVSDCYAALGVIHSHWRPVPGKIKDYIAFPKPNGYQSIHTTVYSGDGGAIEIQLRTEAMHQEAQYGIAAHLTYKERQHDEGASGRAMEWVRQFFSSNKGKMPDGNGAVQSQTEVVPQWMQDLAQVDDEAPESEEYMDTLKADFFNHRVFVFTPRSDVIDLPLHATPVDFAYCIHSDLGNHMAGARVNGKMVSLDTPLKNGDMVEIIQKQSARPSRKWLDMAKTTMAKKHIRTALSEQRK